MKLALLGPGRIADIVAQALVATPEIECYAVASRNRERAEAFAEKFGFFNRGGLMLINKKANP